MLKDKYSSTMGRTSEDVIRMFKYFLNYEPEETRLIDSSLLTVFRRERLKDNDENLMDKLIEKTVEIAIEKGLIDVKNKIIVDSTHTHAMFNHISPRNIQKIKMLVLDIKLLIHPFWDTKLTSLRPQKE